MQLHCEAPTLDKILKQHTRILPLGLLTSYFKWHLTFTLPSRRCFHSILRSYDTHSPNIIYIWKWSGTYYVEIVNKYNEAMRVDPITEVQQSRHILDKFDTRNFHLRFTVNTLAGRKCRDTNLSCSVEIIITQYSRL